MNNCRRAISAWLKLIIILSVMLSLHLPFPCSAKPYTDKKPTFSPFTTIIKSLSITRPTIVINVDDLEKSSNTTIYDDDNFAQYLKLLPTIKQGKISGLSFVLLSRINKWKLVLNNLTLIINNFQPEKNSLWQLTATYELQHPALKAAGTISMELQLDTIKKKFNGRGGLAVTGRSSDHIYALSMPIIIDENLVLKPKLSLDGYSPITSELQVMLPTSDNPLWKVTCSGELTDLVPIAAMLRTDKPSAEIMLPKSGQLYYRLALAGGKTFLRPPYDVSLQFKAKKFQFQSANADVAIEDIGFFLDAAMSVPRNGPGILKMSTILHGSPFLWHNYFWDLTGHDASGIFECTLPFRNGFPVLDSGISFSGRIEADPLWTGSLNGIWSPDKGTLSFNGQPMDIARTIKIFMPEFLEAQPQILQGLKAEGRYQLSATMEKEGDKITIIDGKILVSGGNIGSKGYGQLHDLEVSMPLAGLTWDDKADKFQVSSQAAPVILKFGSITGPYLHAKAQTMPVNWGAESLSIPTMIDVVAIGCPIKIGNFIIYHPLLAAQRRADLQLEVKPAPLENQLSELPVSAKIIELINDIRHHLQAGLTLSFAGNQLEVRGKVRFPLFSGRVGIENIQVRRLFSSSRVIALDMKARKLNLQEVTALMQAGSATGIIDINLKNLEFSYGQPSKFDLEIKSVKTSDVPQKISVEAIENLSLISSGSNASHGLLNVGINRFFSHYRYGKIGLYCRLRDDAFQLRGLIHQGGREYVVKRGFLTGVDVINYNPDNRISFRDMQERVLRIFNNK